ncbi:MAG: HAD family phosphatase [bacterium]|nr:HAD family phosphatase [bacterium]MBU1919103.1 HAD family phosphatase [bacterium]
MNSKTVIFDMDGVLVESGPFHLEAWQLLGKKYGMEVKEGLFYETFGMRNDELMPRLFPGVFKPEDYNAIHEEKEKYYRECAKGKIEAPIGLIDFIEELKTNQFILAVGSSAPRANIEFILDELKIRKFFDHSVSGHEVNRGKPAPDVFIAAAKKCGVSADQCVVIEDAVAGVEAAKAAHMKCVAITSSTPREKLCGADLVVDSFRELKVSSIIDLL